LWTLTLSTLSTPSTTLKARSSIELYPLGILVRDCGGGLTLYSHNHLSTDRGKDWSPMVQGTRQAQKTDPTQGLFLSMWRGDFRCVVGKYSLYRRPNLVWRGVSEGDRVTTAVCWNLINFIVTLIDGPLLAYRHESSMISCSDKEGASAYPRRHGVGRSSRLGALTIRFCLAFY
jgi:hypothetical protein